jgi:hypothetical protein
MANMHDTVNVLNTLTEYWQHPGRVPAVVHKPPADSACTSARCTGFAAYT